MASDGQAGTVWDMILDNGNVTTEERLRLAQTSTWLRSKIERRAERYIRRLEALSNDTDESTAFSTLEGINPKGFLFARVVYKVLVQRRLSYDPEPYIITQYKIEKEYKKTLAVGLEVKVPMPFQNDHDLSAEDTRTITPGEHAYHWHNKKGAQDYVSGSGPKADQAFIIRLHSGQYTPRFYLPENWGVHPKVVEWHKNIFIIQFVTFYSTDPNNRHPYLFNDQFPVTVSDILVIDAERWNGAPFNVAKYMTNKIWPKLWTNLNRKFNVVPTDYSHPGQMTFGNLLEMPAVVKLTPEPRDEIVRLTDGQASEDSCVFWLHITGNNSHVKLHYTIRISFLPEEPGLLATQDVHFSPPKNLDVTNERNQIIHSFDFDAP